MQFVVDYDIYKVLFQAGEALYSLITRDMSQQFRITGEAGDPVGRDAWVLQQNDTLYAVCSAVCMHTEYIEHNLPALVHDTPGEKYILAPDKEWGLKLHKGQKKIAFWAGNAEQAWFILKKVLRQISKYEHTASKHFFLHSSSIVCGDNGIVFLGDKGMGKTTLLLNLLQRKKDFAYLGNDMVAVDRSMQLYGIFSKVGIGAGTLAFMQEGPGTGLSRDKGKKRYYEFGEFRELFGVKSRNKARLSAIIFIEDNQSERMCLEETPAGDRQRFLRQNLLIEGKDEELSDHPNWLTYGEKQQTEQEHIDALCQKVGEAIPCYTLSFHIARAQDYACLADRMDQWR